LVLSPFADGPALPFETLLESHQAASGFRIVGKPHHHPHGAHANCRLRIGFLQRRGFTAIFRASRVVVFGRVTPTRGVQKLAAAGELFLLIGPDGCANGKELAIYEYPWRLPLTCPKNAGLIPHLGVAKLVTHNHAAKKKLVNLVQCFCDKFWHLVRTIQKGRGT
jgi:hypothetical protein